MTTNRFLDRLSSGKTLVIDGATGTNLQMRGLPRGVPSDMWVLDNPAQVQQLHADFLAAGSDIVLTDTFGATRPRLEHAGLGERMQELNTQAVALARAAAAPSDALVAGSMGPTGQMMDPLGPLTEEAAEAIFTEQARLLAAAGVDLLVVETQFDLSEARAAVRGALSTGLPVGVSFSYDRGVRTMMGVRPTQVAEEFGASGVSFIGINCGRSLDENLQVLKALRAASTLPIWFKPNAGLPQTTEDGGIHYDVTPEAMGGRVAEWLEAGAQLVGGCCGTSVEHLRAIAQAAK